MMSSWKHNRGYFASFKSFYKYDKQKMGEEEHHINLKFWRNLLSNFVAMLLGVGKSTMQ